MRAALVDENGEILARRACVTEPGRGIEDAASRLAEMFRRVSEPIEQASISGVGVSTAGPIDPKSGYYSYPPNLVGWHGRSMKGQLERDTGLRVTIGHDAHVAAIAESRFGAAKGARDVVYVTVSTGIGGGMISDGAPVNGAHGMAGEIGHLIIDPSGPACNAGCHGCLEVLASGGGVQREARQRIEAGEETLILQIAGGDPDAVTGRIVYEAAARGDLVAGAIVDGALDALATGLANILATFDPSVLVMGGSVMEGLHPYWENLLQRVQGRGLRRFREGVPIAVSKLGDDVGLLGAAVMAFQAEDEAR